MNNDNTSFSHKPLSSTPKQTAIKILIFPSLPLSHLPFLPPSLSRGPMSSVCKSAVGCVVDSRLPLRSSYINLYKWAESDAEFVRSVATAGAGAAPFPNSRAIMEPSHRLVDSYSSRQMYLRSYTFSKKETMPEKTVKCFGKVKEKATDFPFIHHQRKGSGGSFSSFISCRSCNKKKKGCSVFYSIFRRLLSCTMSVEVAEADCGGDDAAAGSSRFGG